ncbi:T9SS type A sorting domain-containing protein [Flavobacterium jejuense]|uniref:T9SS type A sorting domain-containing protein n=1 Tax=Flavobacterium jejuense TaxID=1544455 RepID=A0ABX0J245_9FLAO|nr:T9SS type A sorting domain-containing protein [Flavobacterium jejuense]NHN28044.1 T9SS type A sorting domain-containing protein [Flavobacterium jejuense]
MSQKLLFIFLLFSYALTAQNCVESVTCSDDTVSVLLSDGTIYNWGQNGYGQLGIGTATSEDSPVLFSTQSDWEVLTYGRLHSAGLKNDGTIWSWGNNDLGQLGNGTNTTSNTPAPIGNENDWISISAGNLHSVALKSDGTLWGWGNNQASELLDFSIYPATFTAPVQMSTDTDWDKIYAGYFRTFGIKNDGTLWGRGNNSYGAIGTVMQGFINDFTQVGSDADWVKVSGARSRHTLALKSNGTLWAWGNNENGKLGDGTIINRPTPIQIGTSQWKDIAAGVVHSLGIKADGTLWQWGSYGWIEGQLLIPNNSSPVQVGTDTDWKSIAAGYSISFAVKEDNTLWGWGFNTLGWLGNGSTVSTANPVLIIDCTNLSTSDFENNEISIYPNPTENYLNWSGNITEGSSYEIINTIGQKIITGTIDLNKKEINVATIPTGMYVLMIQTKEGNLYQQKFLKK